MALAQPLLVLAENQGHVSKGRQRRAGNAQTLRLLTRLEPKTEGGDASTIAFSGAASGAAPQTLSGKNCVGSSAGSQYLLFSTTGPAVSANVPAGIGYKDLSLGVRSGNDSNGTSCKQVNPGTTPRESLRFQVNPAVLGAADRGHDVLRRVDVRVIENRHDADVVNCVEHLHAGVASHRSVLG